MQTSIFDILYEKYKITKPIRLIEFFAGYGSQALALKYLGVPFEHYKISEWAIKSIHAYKDIHFTNIEKDYTKDMSKEDLVEYFKEHNISSNYNEPLNEQQLKRLSETQLRTIYNNMKITNNLGSIVNVKGDDLKIVDKDKYEYIMTYSFPCQDLSLAGKRLGMNDTSTRSGMLWEVERILDECKEKPQILLMENVPQIHGEGNIDPFIKWQLKLESLGYKNYWQDLIATDYGIPQTRNRTFMISILGDYSYTFTKPISVKLKLKKFLEDNVDEKYYINDDEIKHILKTKKEKKYYTQYDRYNGKFEQLCRVWKNISPTLHTKSNEIIIYDKNKIRKLTPKECFRLMGVKDEDYDNVSKNQSNASLYHLAGDSIVVNVLMAIFKELL